MRVALVFALAAATWAPAQAAAIRAVVVGIDDYAHISKLEGAVNDARDIARALEGRGADVTLLLDRAATRAAVVAAVRDAMARSAPGDAVVFTFAGHGAQHAEALPGDEDDGMDESFIFAGYDERGAAAGERLRDNDVAVLLAEAPRDVGVFFVADSCHSGTMTRAPTGPASLGRTRFLDAGPIEDDPLEPPPAWTFRQEMAVESNVVFAAAAREDQLTPEVLIDGERRGALSFTVARAFEGGAAGSEDIASLDDLRSFVREGVRSWSEARQTPDVVYRAEAVTRTEGTSPAQDALLRLFNPRGAQGGNVAAPGASAALALAEPPVIHHAAAGPAPADAALIWDPETGALTDRVSGDLLAEPADKAALAAAALKWRAARGLARWVPARGLEARLAEGDGRHAVGQSITITVAANAAAPDHRFLTLVNLAGDGKVQYVYPSPAHESRGTDRLDPPGAEPRRFGPIPVIEPIGADTLLAVATRERPEALRAALRALDGRADPEALLDVLRRHAGEPADARVGMLPIFTGRRP